MSAAFISGFETRDFKEWSSTSGTPAINTSIQPTGDCCAELGSLDQIGKNLAASEPDWACSVKFRFSANVSFDTAILAALNGAATTRFSLALNSSENLELTVPTSQNGNQVLSAGTWYEIHVVHNYVDGSDDVIDIYIDDAVSPDISVTTASNNDAIRFFFYGASTGIFYFDDVRIDDVATKIGDHKIVRADPDGIDTAFSYGDETDVDDWVLTADDDTTTEAGLTDIVRARTTLDDYTDLSIGASDTINAIKVSSVCKRGGGQGRIQEILARDHGLFEDRSGDLDMTTSYLYYEYYSVRTMPTPSQFDSWQAGILKSASGGQDMDCTALALMVDYTPAGNGVIQQSVVAIAVGSPVVSKLPKKIIGATSIGSVLVKRKMFKTASVTAVASPSVIRKMFETVVATAIGVPLVTRLKQFTKIVTATAIGVATVAKLPRKVIAATAVGVPTVTRQSSFYRTITATAVGSSLVVRKMYETISATAIVVPLVATQVRFTQAVVATAVGVATVTKLIKKMIVATAIGDAVVKRKMFVSAVATTVGVAVVVEVAKFFQSVTATAVGVVGVATSYIPFAPSGVTAGRFIKWMGGFIGR